MFKIFYQIPIPRFHDKRVVMTSSEELVDDLPPPSITICPIDKKSGMGFRDVLNIGPYQDFKGNLIPQMCEGKEGPEIIDCIEEKAINGSLAVKYLMKGFQEEKSVPEANFWTREFSHSSMGICSTIKPPFSLGTTFIKEAIWIGLNESYKFAMFFHDPDFFLINFIPSLPFNAIMLNASDGTMTQRMLVVQHHKLNVPHRQNYNNAPPTNSPKMCSGHATQTRPTNSPRVWNNPCQRGSDVGRDGTPRHPLICQSVKT